MHDSQELVNRFPVLEYFRAEHLAPELREVSEPMCRLAWDMAARFYDNEGTEIRELYKGLDKLLEAKDCFVRARVQ